MVTYPNRQVYIIAPTLDQPKIIFNEVARHFQSGPLSVLVEGIIIETPFPRITLSNGSQCHGRGANSPAYSRGKPVPYCPEGMKFYPKQDHCEDGPGSLVRVPLGIHRMIGERYLLCSWCVLNGRVGWCLPGLARHG